MKHKHASAYSIDFYACSSKLSNWNDTFKVLSAFLILLLSISLDNIYVSLFIIVTMAYFSVRKGGMHLHDYLRLISIPFTFMILATIAIAFCISKEPVSQYNLNLHLFYLYFSNDSIIGALKIVFKALAALSAMYMMTLSTTASDIITVFKKLHIPSMLIELMNIIYRFIFILIDSQCKMKNAAESRLGYIDFKTSCYSFGSTSANLLVVSLKKANNYYNAMEARCYEGDMCFLEEPKKIKGNQIFLLIMYVLIILFIWYFTRR